MKYAALILCSFIFGFYVNGIRLDLKFTEFKLNAEKQYARLLKDKFLQEEALRNEVKHIEQEKETAISDINASYTTLLDKYNSLYSDHRNSNSEDSLSNASSPSSRSKPDCTCKPFRQNGQSIKELLKIARNCDLLAERYNRLLKIYQTYQEGLNHGD